MKVSINWSTEEIKLLSLENVGGKRFFRGLSRVKYALKNTGR